MISDLVMMIVGIGALYAMVYGMKWVFDKVEEKFKI